MFEGLSTFNEVLLVHGRLRMGKIGVLGAISSVVLFAGSALVMIVDWIWKLLSGTPIWPEHEIFNGNLEFSFLLVIPIIWIGVQVVKGRFFLSRKNAEIRRKLWQNKHWKVWNSEGPFSIATTNFIMSSFGVLTMLCFFGGLVNAFASIS